MTGNSPGEVDLIRQGRIDCFICTYSVAFALRQTKEPLEYFSVDSRCQRRARCFHATRATLEQKPDLCSRCCERSKPR